MPEIKAKDIFAQSEGPERDHHHAKRRGYVTTRLRNLV